MLNSVARWGDGVFWAAIVAAAGLLRTRTTIWYAGLGIAAVAFPLWVAARLQLGASFSARPEARELITTGLYWRIRHPIYVFGCLAYFGALTALQVWPVLVVWLALTPIEVTRARREERVLESAFGEAYRTYREATWF